MSNVFVFNTGPTPLYLNVNNAPPPKILTIPGADSSTWLPGTLAAADLPQFTGKTTGANGEFWVGTNEVALTLSTGGSTASVSVPIPSSVNPTDTLQLYVFWESVDHVSWMLLKSGLPIGGSVSIPT